MRTKLLSFLMLLTVAINYGQTTASAAGIAIQGIARDNNGNARINTQISLTLKLYYVLNNAEVAIVTSTVKNADTDGFGVFSLVLETKANENILIANTEAYLRISDGSTTISDEKLKQVPYAIAASNGVPTGSIMPYIGNTAPAGWVMCNGSALPSDALGGAALRALVGDNAPNLQGMFLRGAGENNVYASTIEPNNLKAFQNTSNLEHDHSANASSTPDHYHNIFSNGYTADNNGSGPLGEPTTDTKYKVGHYNNDDGDWKTRLRYTNSTTEPIDRGRTSNNGGHDHTITVNSSGGSESRPINYGVNYIIKL
jgi:hypothetical protein